MTEVILDLATDSPVPPYEQLRAQIITMVASGVLATGSRLPPIRQLAGDLGIASGTVARAYRELERDGVVVSRGRHGTYVLDQWPVATSAAARADRERVLSDAAHRFAVQVRQLGVSPAAALERARLAIEALAPQPR